MDNEKNLNMSQKERDRSKILEQVKSQKMSLKEAAILMNLSYRQTRTVYKRYLQDGDAGLVHKHRGKPSNRASDQDFKQTVLKRYRERYEDFGPTLAAEKLALDGYDVSAMTLWRWLIQSEDWKKRDRKRIHRKRRKCRSHFGELVQLDGSEHDWFENRADRCVLMNLVDDATNRTFGLLYKKESTESAMRVLWEWIKKYGIPHSLYTDRHAVYFPLNTGSKGDLTQFGRACKELGIKIIYARSPQAKGKIEKKMLSIKIAL